MSGAHRHESALRVIPALLSPQQLLTGDFFGLSVTAVSRRIHGFTPGAQGRKAVGLEPQLLASPITSVAPSYHGGPLIKSIEACALFVGAGWTEPPASNVARRAQFFIEFFVKSQILKQLAVFDHGDWQVTQGMAHPAVYLDGAQVNAAINDSEIRAFLSAAIGTNSVPETTPDSLYILFFPDGVTVTDPDVGASCDSHCGYHSNNSGTPYIVMPYLSCGFCLPSGTSVSDAMTAALSHEISEAITDPLGNAWYADNGTQDEIGDLCNGDGWKTKRVGGFLVQQFCLPTGVCW